MLLTNKPSLTSNIEFEGASFCIDVRFKNIIKVIQSAEDNDLSTIDKLYVGLYLLTKNEVLKKYIDNPNLYSAEAITKASELYEYIFSEVLANGKETEVETDLAGNPLPVQEENEKVMSYIHDQDYIFSSFVQAYGIRLYEETDSMSWNEFQSLLNGLPDDTKLMKVIEIRTMDIPKGKGTEEQAKAVKKAKKQYRLPD